MDESEQPTMPESHDSTVAVDEQPVAASEAATEAPHTNGNGRTRSDAWIPDRTHGRHAWRG